MSSVSNITIVIIGNFGKQTYIIDNINSNLIFIFLFQQQNFFSPKKKQNWKKNTSISQAYSIICDASHILLHISLRQVQTMYFST